MCWPRLCPPWPWPAKPSLGGHTFTLPEGFTLELAAEPPLVERPIVAEFDDRGRLYVAEASGTNDPVAKQLADKPHRIVRLEDTDDDGVFDKRTVYADRFMLPEGLMWLDGSLYVGRPPASGSSPMPTTTAWPRSAKSGSRARR